MIIYVFFYRTQRTANRVLTARSAAFLGAFSAQSAGFEKNEAVVDGFEAQSTGFAKIETAVGAFEARSAVF